MKIKQSNTTKPAAENLYERLTQLSDTYDEHYAKLKSIRDEFDQLFATKLLEYLRSDHWIARVDVQRPPPPDDAPEEEKEAYEAENNKYGWLAKGDVRIFLRGKADYQLSRILSAWSGYDDGMWTGHQQFKNIFTLKTDGSMQIDTQGENPAWGLTVRMEDDYLYLSTVFFTDSEDIAKFEGRINNYGLQVDYAEVRQWAYRSLFDEAQREFEQISKRYEEAKANLEALQKYKP